ncbi:MAG TPA: DUF4062 domain-containing protein [Candidatus Limiplasma sp.]|nr:DUF4062 domain-containing protein [Candidatus Limiplasma sp.]
MLTLRIFISSTFNDFILERNALHKTVFPKAAELCHKHGCAFQVIDLRWGISVQDSQDYSTLGICLNEIERCQRVTPRPNFIFLAGERYGWRPLPQYIDHAIYRRILSVLPPQQRGKLETAYVEDNNAIPASYAFVSIPKDSTEDELRSMLFTAAEKLSLNRQEWLALFASATHRELMARLRLPDFPGGSICAVRHLRNVPPENIAQYYDTRDDGSRDEKAYAQALQLRDDVAAMVKNPIRYTLDLSAAGERDEELKEFCDAVYAQIEAHIHREMEKSNANELGDEISYHHGKMEDYHRAFAGRETDIRRAWMSPTLVFPRKSLFLPRKIQGAKPLFILGGPGSGKSSLMAELASRVAQDGNADVIMRFIGATAASADVKNLLYGICAELGGEDHPIAQQADALAAQTYLAEYTAQKGRAAVVFLDGIENATKYRMLLRTLLGKTLPSPAIRLVLSMDEALYAETKAEISAAHDCIHLGRLSLDDAKAIINKTLALAGRTLTAGQRSRLLEIFSASPDAAYLSILANNALSWRSGDAGAQVYTGAAQYINAAFEGLISRKHFSPIITRRMIGYLLCARAGLSDDELIGVLSADRDVLQEFLRGSFHLSPGMEEGIRAYLAGVGIARKPVEWLQNTADLGGLIDALYAASEPIMLPYAYFSRIQYELQPYLKETLSEGTRVYSFADKRAKDAAEQFAADEDFQLLHARLGAYFAADPKTLALAYFGAGLAGLLKNDTMRKYLRSRVAYELPYQLIQAREYDKLEIFLGDETNMSFLLDWNMAELCSLWATLENETTHTIPKTYRAILDKARKAIEEGRQYSDNEGRTLSALMGARGGYADELQLLSRARIGGPPAETGEPKADTAGASEAEYMIAQSYLDKGEFEKALDITTKALEKYNHTVSIGCHDMIYAHAQALYRLEHYEESRVYFEEMYLMATLLGEKSRIINGLKWRASCAKVLGEKEKSLELYRELENLCDDNDDKAGLASVYFEMATHAFLYDNDFDEAFELMDKTIKIVKELGNRAWLVTIHGTRINMYYTLNRFDRVHEVFAEYVTALLANDPGTVVPCGILVPYFACPRYEESKQLTMLYAMETYIFLEQVGNLNAALVTLPEHAHSALMACAYERAFSLLPDSLRYVVEHRPANMEFFLEAMDYGIAQAYSPQSAEEQGSLMKASALADKQRNGEALDTEEKQRLDLCVSLLCFMMYDIGSIHDAVRESGSAEGLRNTLSAYASLLRACDTRLKKTVSHWEYQRRRLLYDKVQGELLEAGRKAQAEYDSEKGFIKDLAANVAKNSYKAK